MESRAATEEKGHFSERLMKALVNASCPVAPGDFVKEFNLRADGATVTVYAARKWLTGGSIPTQEKINILARWLGVSAAWLRFGMVEDGPMPTDPQGLDQPDRRLLDDVHRLKERDRQVVYELVKTLLRHPG